MTARARQQSAAVLLAMVVVASAHLALGRASNHVLGADDDRLWLYFSGASLNRSAEAQDLQNRVSQSMQAHDVHENDSIRINLRRDYAGNYLGASVVYRLAAEALEKAAPREASDYPMYVARSLFSGFIAAYVLVAIFVLLVALLCGKPRITLAVFVSIALTGLLESLVDLTGNLIAGSPMLLPRAGDRAVAPVQTFLQNAFGLAVDPGIAFSVFGDTPRNHFLLATIAIFALRWAGHYRAAALALLALSFLHQSMTSMLFMCLLTCDLLLRPEIFSRVSMWLIAVTTLVVSLSRETLGPYVAYGSSVAATVIVICASALIFGAIVSLAHRQPAWLAGIVGRIRGANEEWSDVRMLFVLWLISVPPVAVANAFVGTNASLYFWAQAHGRLLAILRPMLVLAVSVAIVTRSTESNGPRPARAWWLVAACAVALLPGAWLATRFTGAPIVRLASALRTLDGKLGPSIDWSSIGTRSEDEIYYGLARTLESQDRGVR